MAERLNNDNTQLMSARARTRTQAGVASKPVYAALHHEGLMGEEGRVTSPLRSSFGIGQPKCGPAPAARGLMPWEHADWRTVNPHETSSEILKSKLPILVALLQIPLSLTSEPN